MSDPKSLDEQLSDDDLTDLLQDHCYNRYLHNEESDFERENRDTS